jgi:dipeptidyl aminopeptidase/acylaminoacyl peptidase
MMSKHTSRWAPLLTATAVLLAAFQACAADEAPKKETFFRALTIAAMSPDGKHIVGFAQSRRITREIFELAARSSIPIGGTLYLIDPDTLDFKRIPGGSKWVNEGFWRRLSSVRSVRWATNDLVILEYPEDAVLINLRGEEVMHLGNSVIGNNDPASPAPPALISVYGNQIRYVNVATKQSRKIAYPTTGKPIGWAVDASGTLRALSLLNSEFWKDATTITNWFWNKEKEEWEQLAEFKVTERFWRPEGVLEDGKSLAVSTNIGRDTVALFSYDTQRHAMGEMLAGHPTEDIRYVAGLSQSKFMSVVTDGLKPRTTWLDPAWNLAQRTADAALPDRINEISGIPDKRVLILSHGDVDSGTWYLLDMQARRLKRFAMVNPQVDPKKMRPMETTTFAAKDGMAIPAYLTRPEKATGPAPMVVMIHGGPTARNRWAWDPEVQVLAQRGYVVLQPQFRGSTGFGAKFMEAGFGQWGLGMQDDITAGVEAMIQRGIADPRRICIYGASYGGYAALWGLVKTPQLYRCGVSFAGVSDIELMLTDWSDANSNKVTRELIRFRVGDVSLSKAQFDAVSPLKHADRIEAPVLLMHGDKDERVPISHSRKMMSALDANKKTYEWHEFAGEGHGLTAVESRQVFLRKLLAFLEKYIAPDKAPAPTDETDSPAPGEPD